jgi:hypothetical protein
MKRILARTLLAYSTEDLWSMLAGEFVLVFEDGNEIPTNRREALYSSYFWDFHRLYPTVPILSKHHVSYAFKNGYLVANTHIKLLQSIYWDVVDTIGFKTPADRDSLTKMVYEITNEVYVKVSERSEANVASIDISDFVGVAKHKPVFDLVNNTLPQRANVAAANEEILKILYGDPSLDNNNLAKAVRGGMVNARQILQCVGLIGYLPDVDGYIIPTPVMSNYTLGLRTMFNMSAESRSAAMSLYYSESPLQDAEYFARRLQLLCMSIERVHYTDCGSTDYVLWRVKPPVSNANERLYAGDLRRMIGKYYLDEATGLLNVIHDTDAFLNGTTVKLRSVLTCKHPDPHGVCAVCFGKMADNLNPSGNIGHVSAATVTKQTGQSILGTKHLVGNSSSEPIMLGDGARKYFKVGKNTSTYILNQEMFKAGNVKLVVSQEEAFGLTDIDVVERIEDINPTRVSEIEYVGFQHTVNGVVLPVTQVYISQNKRAAMFTLDFLKYLKIHKWEIDTRGNFVFDLQFWDMTKPIFILPEMVYSFSHHSHQVAEIIESRMKNISDRLKASSPAATLVELFDLVNSKLNVNIALLEIIIYATMVADGANNNFNLARNSPNASLGVAGQMIRNRSLGPGYAYENQAAMITDPRSFYIDHRPDSLFDVFICPEEVVQSYR